MIAETYYADQWHNIHYCNSIDTFNCQPQKKRQANAAVTSTSPAITKFVILSVGAHLIESKYVHVLQKPKTKNMLLIAN